MAVEKSLHSGTNVASDKGGPVKTKNSGDYEGWFKNYSLPLATLGSKGQKLVSA